MLGKLYQKMLNYREITVFDAIANTQILLPDLLRIVHQYALPVLFWEANDRNRECYKKMKEKG